VIRICTDSTYVIGCARDWAPQWRATNFRNNTICNRAIIELLWEELNQAPIPVEWQWVKGHDASEGNIQADKLAVNASLNFITSSLH
jgi:ribonuclease HI